MSKDAIIHGIVQNKLQQVSYDDFYAKCEELWRADGCSLTGDMMGIIREEYNNAAIEAFVDQFTLEVEEAWVAEEEGLA